jgi:hypothetical protein
MTDVVQGKEELCVDLGTAQRRDPDALPPGNPFEVIMSILYHSFRGLSQGNQLFAIKAGILTSQHLWLRIRRLVLMYIFTALLSIPSFLKTSASLAYGMYSENTW